MDLMDPDVTTGWVVFAAMAVWLLAACCMHVKRGDR